MLMLPPSVQLLACTTPVDMRKSFDGLAMAVEQVLGAAVAGVGVAIVAFLADLVDLAVAAEALGRALARRAGITDGTSARVGVAGQGVGHVLATAGGRATGPCRTARSAVKSLATPPYITTTFVLGSPRMSPGLLALRMRLDAAIPQLLQACRTQIRRTIHRPDLAARVFHQAPGG